MDSDKIALAPPPKDSQNEQRNSTSQDSKDGGISLVPESEMMKKPPSSCGQSPATNAASGRLVYVRRRVELDTAKSTNKPTLPLAESAPLVSPSSHRLDWEERYHHLQMLLNNLNDSHQTDHVQSKPPLKDAFICVSAFICFSDFHALVLWSLSSAELSKHAVELEKRSIQFSLEEGNKYTVDSCCFSQDMISTENYTV